MMKSVSVLALIGAALGAVSALADNESYGEGAAGAGAASIAAAADYTDSATHWGYGYDSLLKDLDAWRKSPFVKVDSIGASVQGRAIWMLTISGPEDSLGPIDDSSSKKHRVMIHARTHPSEVQANYIANEAVKYLINDTLPKAEELRRGFVFNIIPMYNPDGVQLGHSRRNAHLVDLESDWNEKVVEPEVAALKKQFETFQAGPLPVEVALNLHSDTVNCTRFFFYHVAAGTSAFYETLEKQYVAGVQAFFPGGIRDWNFITSWGDGVGVQYPEGFWWLTQQEKVLALTYEDSNCPNARLFDSTGQSLVLGSAEYVRNRPRVAVRPSIQGVSRMVLVSGGVRIPAGTAGSQWTLRDLQGRRLAGGELPPSGGLLAWNDLPAAPFRILSVSHPGGSAERIRLPILPE